MKRLLLLFLIIFALSCVLISCGGGGNDGEDVCAHSFSSATCTVPPTCTLCGITDGAPNGHSFAVATCQAPKTCTGCGVTEGEIGAHAWKGASCLSARTCDTCGLTDGEALGHDWPATLCTLDKLCKSCGEKKAAEEHTWNTNECEKIRICEVCEFLGEKLPHDLVPVTCTTDGYCQRCETVFFTALGHNWLVNTCKNPKVCQRCNESTTEDLPHDWQYLGCDKERVCNVCSQGEGDVYGHKWIEATCTEAKHCKECGEVEGEPVHDWQEATCLAAKTCSKCKLKEGAPLGHNKQLVETVEPSCAEGRRVYFCDRCKINTTIYSDPIYSYHICEVTGRCIQCDNLYDVDEMTLESVLLVNEHSLECCGLFTSTETKTPIYKSITAHDVGMPVIDLGGSLPTTKTNEYENVVDFVYESDDLSFVCRAQIKVQGASSSGKPKKNFNIKLVDSDGGKNKVELSDGWGKENKYCMKANYIDYSQARNVVSGKIFGEIVKSRNDELSDTPNGGAIDGFPVLVYNDGVFHGIYTMNIPKDKWMFDMEDSDEKNQAIVMTTTWNRAVSFKEISTAGFEIEYASNEDSEIDNSTQWVYDSLLELITFVYNNDGEDFKNGIHQYADIDKCIDSMLYTFFICADDNTSKNILWVTLDGKVWFSSMYDMDGTWGMRWNGNIEFNEYTHPISSLADGKGLAPERNQSNLNLLWERIYVNYFDRVCERYAELRGEILSLENITNHFEAFFNSIPDVVRAAEKKKWTGVPTQNIDHLEQILTFIEKRMVVMDGILLYSE